MGVTHAAAILDTHLTWTGSLVTTTMSVHQPAPMAASRSVPTPLARTVAAAILDLG